MVRSAEKAGLPGGTVTFLFSDIEGSTSLWETSPDVMDRALLDHDEIVRTHVRSAGGKVIKHTGDGFSAVFVGPMAAVEAAVGISRSLAAHEWGPCPIRVRMGIHAGVAYPRDGDYFGPTINQAARVMDAGNGGQVLLSDAAAVLARSALPAGVMLADLGSHRLKGLGEPVHLWHLVVSGGASDDRAVRTLDSLPNNLPAELSSFVGRRDEIVELCRAFRHTRLVTLTGIGGVGKTRLALQVAAQLIDRYADGVWLIELASLSEPQFLPQTALAALKLPAPIGSQDPLELLLSHLARRRALIVLDNCEHLIDDVAKFVESLLAVTRDLNILATSREALAVGGELRWQVPSLGQGRDADEAIDLFVDRAASLVPGFELTAENSSHVETICRRLDGIPLAIELAVGRLTMLTPAQLAEYLDDRFHLLAVGPRTAVARQRTLLGMMDWSHDLLTSPERVLLRRLSVFSGGFDLESVQAVCGSDPLSPLEVFDRLGRLVDESMVQFERDPDARYRLLETVRVYASEKLVAAGELDETSARHADHFERVAAGIEALVAAGDVQAALQLGRLELVNLRAAMTWSYDAGRPDQGLSMAVHLRDVFWMMQDFREGLTWLRRGLDIVPPTVSPLYVRAVYYAMTDAANMEAVGVAAEYRVQAEQLLDVVHDPIMLADLNNAIANTLDGSDPRTGLARYATAIDLYRSAGSDRWIRPQGNRIFHVSLTGDVSDIEMHIQRGYDAQRSGLPAIGFPAPLQEAWYRLVAGQPDAASQALEKTGGSPLLAVSVWLRWAKIETLRQQGRLEACEQEITELRAKYGAAVDWGDFPLLAITLAWVAFDLGHLALALDRWDPVAWRAALPGQRVWRAATATFQGIVATRRGDWDRGATLLGYAELESERCGYRPFVFDRHRVDDARVTLREALGHEVFSDAYARGESTPYDDLPLYRAPLTGTR